MGDVGELMLGNAKLLCKDKQYNGISKPKREMFIDDIIPDGI